MAKRLQATVGRGAQWSEKRGACYAAYSLRSTALTYGTVPALEDVSLYMNNAMQNIGRVLRDAAVSGSAASILSTVVLSAASKHAEDSAAGALNGPSQWVWGERQAYTRRATLRHTAVGYAIHHAMSIFWATFYEAAFDRVRRSRARVSTPQILGEATAMTAIAFFVDYVVTPRRFRPGFRKHIGRGALVANYAAFALGLALTSVVRRGRKRE